MSHFKSAPVSHLHAIALALAGFTFWVLSDTCMKLAGETALPPYEIVAFLGLFGVVFMMMKAGYEGKIRALWPRSPQKQLARALLAFATNLCNALAFKHMPLTLFYVTVFTAPLVISLLASIFLDEKLKRLGIIAIIGGFAGMVIAVDPFSHAAHGDWIGYTATLTGVCLYSASTLWLRVMTQSESADSMAFFTSFVEVIIGLAVMLLFAVPVSFKTLVVLAIMSFFCVVGNLCIFLALRDTTAANVSQFHYTQIITGALIGYVIWHEVLTWNLFLGTVVIVGAGVIVAMQKQHPRPFTERE